MNESGGYMNAEIVAVGSELLLGQIADTNSQFLSAELAGIGINVYRHTVIGDNNGRLTKVLTEAAKRTDIIIISGGLGPTEDDITKQVVSQLLAAPLLYHEETLEKIESFFQKRGVKMTPNNKKQAQYVEGSDVFFNDVGLACGMATYYDDTLLILLPGPPRELKAMFVNKVKPYLLQKLGGSSVVFSRVLRFFGIGESALEEKIIDIIQNQSNPTVAPLAVDGEVTVRLTAKANTKEEAIVLINEMERRIKERVGKFMYGIDQDTLPLQTARYLRESKQTIAVAESLTGGWFSKILVDMPGASYFLEGSTTVYSKEAKENILSIDRELLEEYGTVSKECAEQMAEQVRKLFGTDIGISFTGSAGPEALEGKKPGTVWISIARPEGTTSHHLELSGGRGHIRRLAVYYGCWFLLKEKVGNK